MSLFPIYRTVGQSGVARRSQRVWGWGCRTFRSCHTDWDAMETCQSTHGCHHRCFLLYQVLSRASDSTEDVLDTHLSYIILGFLSHPQNVYPSYLTPPMSLNHSNLNMSQLNMMAHGHHNGGMRISPQSIPQPSHLPPSAIPVSSAASVISMMQQQNSISTMSPSGNSMHQSPSHNLALRSPSPDKKSADLNVDSPDDNQTDGAAINMTISQQSGTTDIRTNSIAALRIKAKEHLENINKNLTMV